MNTRHIIVKTTIRFAIACLAAVSPAVAQTSGPSEPTDTDILIPELILEVEELAVDDVDAVLPPAGELALGQISIPLPGAGELQVDDSAFAVPLPGELAGGMVSESSFFSSGRLGAGSVNHIVGELSLYKLGDSPRFRVEFAHEGLDGYQFKPAGTGYFSNVNAVSGWIVSESERTELEVDGAFREDVDGLQGQADYFSAGVRSTTASGVFTWRPDPLITLTGAADGSIATRILSVSGGETVPRDQEFALKPSVQGRVTLGIVDLTLTGSYFLRFLSDGEIPLHQDIDLLAGLEIALPRGIGISGDVGVLYDFAGGLTYPWSVGMTALLGEAFDVSLSGGYEVQRLRLQQLWETHPLAAAGSALAADGLTGNARWYGELDARWSGAAGITARGGLRFTSQNSPVDIAPNPTTALYDFVQLGPVNTLGASARVGWQPSPFLQIEAGWTGDFLHVFTGQPYSAIDGSVRVTDRAERFEGALDVRSGFYPQAALPEIGLSGVFNANEGVEFVLELADVLAPLTREVGRAMIGGAVTGDYPFIEPGFRASLFARISL